MNIRLATYDDDIEAFARLGIRDHERSQYAHIPYCVGSVMKMLVEMIDDGMLLIAEHEGKVVGAIGGRISVVDFNHRFRSGAMRFWWVDTPYQKTRLSVQLLDELERIAIDRGCHVWMLCSVDEERERPLARFFGRRGYVLTERTYLKNLR
jgi:GNAT superfamily N-acetyltransferase